MRDELLYYYERELTFLRQMGTQFATRYPKVASRLQLEADKCEDPHVERLIEAFAFLAARIQLKIDDDFPEITEGILNSVYPHALRPVPSMAITEFQPDLGPGKLSELYRIPRGSTLYSHQVNGMHCKFRTCYETNIWPVSVAAAEWKSPDRLKPSLPAADATAALRVELQGAPTVQLPALGMDRLRFFLSGESHLVFKLYELLCSRVTRIIVRDPTEGSRVRPITLPPDSLIPDGFEEQDSILPSTRRSFAGYQILQEFFSFPEKFLFFTIQGLDEVWQAGFKDRAEIVFLFSTFEGEVRRETLENGVTARTFRLNCSPIVNLFPQTAEPILLDQKKLEYPVVPDVRQPFGMEVFSVEDVIASNVKTRETQYFQPLYSFTRGAQKVRQNVYWTLTRRASTRENDNGIDVSVSLLDGSMRTVHPEADTLTIKTLCTNRDLPANLPFGNPNGDFELENAGPLKRIVVLTKPTPASRIPVGKSTQWHLISHLSLNYLSLVSEGKEALQSILRLYHGADSSASRKILDGITRLESRPHFARLVSAEGIAFVRGTRVEMELDETQFVGGGVYLFASVLEFFLGQYASLNSFSQLVVRTRQRREDLHEWPPRAGRQIIL